MAMMDYDTRRDKQATFNREVVPATLKALQALEPDAGWVMTKRADEDLSDWDNRRFKASNGEEFYLSYDNYKHRVSAGAVYGELPNGSNWFPSHNARDLESPNPTWSADTTPDKLARGLVTRFLPAYRIVRAEYLRQCESVNNYSTTIAEKLRRVQEASGGLFTPDAPRNHSRDVITTASAPYEYEGPKLRSGQAQVYSDTDLKLEIRCSFEHGLAILAAIKDLQ